MADDEFTCDLFRFLQLLCEGHNNGEKEKTRQLLPEIWKSKTHCRRWVQSLLGCRFPELPAYADREHHHHQHHHLHCGLPAALTGGLGGLFWNFPFFLIFHVLYRFSPVRRVKWVCWQCSWMCHSHFSVLREGVHQRLLLVLLWQGNHRWAGKKELLQSHDSGQADLQQSHRVHPGTRERGIHWVHSQQQNNRTLKNTQ